MIKSPFSDGFVFLLVSYGDLVLQYLARANEDHSGTITLSELKSVTGRRLIRIKLNKYNSLKGRR